MQFHTLMIGHPSSTRASGTAPRPTQQEPGTGFTLLLCHPSGPEPRGDADSFLPPYGAHPQEEGPILQEHTAALSAPTRRIPTPIPDKQPQ